MKPSDELIAAVRALIAPFPGKRILRRSFYANGFSQPDLLALTMYSYTSYDAQFVTWIGEP